jgi:hypothetical protein
MRGLDAKPPALFIYEFQCLNSEGTLYSSSEAVVEFFVSG